VIKNVSREITSPIWEKNFYFCCFGASSPSHHQPLLRPSVVFGQRGEHLQSFKYLWPMLIFNMALRLAALRTRRGD
jgi:hypothetical protein